MPIDKAVKIPKIMPPTVQADITIPVNWMDDLM